MIIVRSHRLCFALLSGFQRIPRADCNLLKEKLILALACVLRRSKTHDVQVVPRNPAANHRRSLNLKSGPCLQVYVTNPMLLLELVQTRSNNVPQQRPAFQIPTCNPDAVRQHQLKIALDIANGMLAVHNAGLIHTDLKPDNILVTMVGWFAFIITFPRETWVLTCAYTGHGVLLTVTGPTSRLSQRLCCQGVGPRTSNITS